MSFTSLGLTPSFDRALAAQNFATPTPIQKHAIPAILGGRDLLGIARTGSGKTASYVLPILQGLQDNEPPSHREPAVLVLVPTRELAQQVHQVFQCFLPILTSRLQSIAIVGGGSINTQMQEIGRAAILVATPGRVLDLIKKNAVRLSGIRTLVLDEADKMLNLGFKDEVDHLLSLLPRKRQNLLFSATLNKEVAHIQKHILSDPTLIEINEENDSIELIRQTAYLVSEVKKGPLLRYLIKQGTWPQALVFASSITKVDSIVNKLLKNQIRAAAMHSKLSPQTRQLHLHEFKTGELPVLVTTDLLARGIDIELLPCVINYELPRSPKDYVHRIGRTGRADHAGDAISLISPEEMNHFRVIQKKIGTRVILFHGDALDLHGY